MTVEEGDRKLALALVLIASNYDFPAKPALMSKLVQALGGSEPTDSVEASRQLAGLCKNICKEAFKGKEYDNWYKRVYLFERLAIEAKSLESSSDQQSEQLFSAAAASFSRATIARQCNKIVKYGNKELEASTSTAARQGNRMVKTGSMSKQVGENSGQTVMQVAVDHAGKQGGEIGGMRDVVVPAKRKVTEPMQTGKGHDDKAGSDNLQSSFLKGGAFGIGKAGGEYWFNQAAGIPGTDGSQSEDKGVKERRTSEPENDDDEVVEEEVKKYISSECEDDDEDDDENASGFANLAEALLDLLF